MMFAAVQTTLRDLRHALDRLDEEQYTMPCDTLSGSSVGQHVRHVVELFQCLLKGYGTAIVDYDARPRNQAIATDKEFARECLDDIRDALSRPDKPMALHAHFGRDGEPFVLSTTYFREVFYNVEHAIHHMALIRIGINEISAIELPVEFGVSPSTLKYQA